MLQIYWKLGIYWRWWTRSRGIRRLGGTLLRSLGLFWPPVAMAAFFFPSWLPVLQHRVFVLVFFVVALVVALYLSRPKLRVSGRLNDRDVEIEVRAGDIFRLPGALVVGTNTTFDTNPAVIDQKSIQGQFTEKYYSDIQQLDRDIEAALAGTEQESTVDIEDPARKRAKYPMGQVALVSPKDRQAYLVAIADLNEHGNAVGTFDGVDKALTNLWTFVAERGPREDVIVPVLGTGFSRVTAKRDEVVRATIDSFMTACHGKVFCEKLTIVVWLADLAKHELDIEEVGQYLRHVCRYTPYAPANPAPSGVGIE